MGPSPMISEPPKTPRMVSPTSNLTRINTLENVQQISIRDPVGPTKLHAPNPRLGNVIPTIRPKFQPDRTSDAPVGPNIQTEQSLEKQAISPSVDLQIENTQQTVGPDSRHVGPTIDFSHSIHIGPSLEAPLPAGPSHLSTPSSYISSLLPTPILSVSQSLDVSRPVDPAIVPSSHVGPTTDLLQTSAFAYDYSLHDRLLTIAGPTGSLSLAVDHYAELRSVIDPVYGSSLHDRLAISVGPTSTLAHSEFFDPLLDHMLAAPRARQLSTVNVTWSKYIPPKISIFIWRLWNNWIPIDDIIRTKLIVNLLSRFQCFSNEET
ncbi:Uncharacterized protein Fot_32265 [Forsythia ovata]|uniref:Reverse transcriptase zinc-binding domain-containing protein n=1 Tax=Forsythia ovata TaxID=205694 RepID=A0ABD1T7A9_9LAMI